MRTLHVFDLTKSVHVILLCEVKVKYTPDDKWYNRMVMLKEKTMVNEECERVS